MAGQSMKVGLVLGAGGARGLAHIGVIQVLQEHKIPVDVVTGSSMGALVGALYATGCDMYLLGKLAETLDMSILWDVRLPRLGFIAGKRVQEFVRLLTKGKNFEDLAIPLGIVATDVINRECVVFKEGPVYEAVRASIAFPGVFTPVRKEDRLLVDGGVTERLPIKLARELGATRVIAVDVTFADARKTRVRTALDVVMGSIEILEEQIFRHITLPQVDILVQPHTSHIGTGEFDRAEECIRLGREAALEKIDEIKQAVAAG
jgi:Predicted esterase of the alpha-beta hydrolase superfamily